MRHNPQPQEMYRHFKGNLYQVRCLARHSETGEMMVVYQAMYGDFQTYARPLSSFMEEIDREKYPDAAGRYRFELFDAQAQGGNNNESRDMGGNEEESHSAKQDTAENFTVNTAANTAMDTAADASTDTECEETQEELNINPLVLQFLDADSYERRLEILSMLHSCIDDNMINTMAVAVDIEIKEGDIEDRYEELKSCLLTFEKFECNRLR